MSVRSISQHQVRDDHAVVGVDRAAGDNSCGRELLANPHLVDAGKGTDVRDCVAPAEPHFVEPIAQPWPEQVEYGIAGRGVEVAADDEW